MSTSWSGFLQKNIEGVAEKVVASAGHIKSQVETIDASGITNNVNQSFRNVNHGIRNVKEMFTPQHPDERVRHVVSQNENLHKSNQHIRQLLKTQGEWYEDKVADLTEEVNLLENKVKYQKKELDRVAKELTREREFCSKLVSNQNNLKQKLEKTLDLKRVTTALNHLDDENLSLVLENIVEIQNNRRKEKKRCEECAVCLAEARCVAFIPCGHLCVCLNCAESIQNTKLPVCPMCRESSEWVRIYD